MRPGSRVEAGRVKSVTFSLLTFATSLLDLPEHPSTLADASKMARALSNAVKTQKTAKKAEVNMKRAIEARKKDLPKKPTRPLKPKAATGVVTSSVPVDSEDEDSGSDGD